MTSQPEPRTALIDRWFPVAAVDEACGTPAGSGQNEKAIFTWFASRPIAQARAAVLCSLLPQEEDADDATIRTLVVEALRNGDEGALNSLAELIPDVDGKRPVVLDCFSGRGIIPLEAARLGLRAVGIDNSPVAVLASRLLADWPLRDWSSEVAVPFPEPGVAVEGEEAGLFAPDSLRPRLISDLRRYFAEVERRTEASVGRLYPKNADGSYPWGYLWATTIPCDACRRRFPLIGSLVLRHPYPKTLDDGQALELTADAEGGSWSVAVISGAATGTPTFSGSEGKKGKSGRCPFCQHIHPLETIKAKGFQGEYEDAPLVAADLIRSGVPGRNGREKTVLRKIFRQLTDEERDVAVGASFVDLTPLSGLSAVPDEPISAGNNNEVQGYAYGAKKWSDLMNSRQAVLFAETARAIRSCHTDVLSAGVSKDYAAVLAAYAASNLVRRLRRATRGAALEVYRDRPAVGVSDVFTNQSIVAFGFTWFETGPGLGPGSWASLTETTLTPLKTHISGLTKLARAGQFKQGTARALPYRDGTVDALIVDPPYYSMIAYADVSDLFYVWLRRCLSDIVPDLFGKPGDSLGLQAKAEEIIVKRGGTAVGDHRTVDWYESEMGTAFTEMRRVLKPGGALTVVFGHSDPDAWRRLLGALREAGFIVTAAWPARTESGNTGVASIKVTVTIGCRVAPAGRTSVTAAQVEREITELVFRRVEKWDRWAMALSDQLMASYGPAMQVVGRYRAILRPDGTEPELDHFLAVGRRAVADAHTFKVDDIPLDTFDPHTRFAIFWMRTFGRTVVNKGEAVFHAQSSQMRVDELRPHILNDTKGGYAITLGEPPTVNNASPLIHIARAFAAAWPRGATEAVGHVLATSGRPPDDPHVWATVGEIVRQLPEADKVSMALTACQRNRGPIQNAARHAAIVPSEQLTIDPTGDPQ